MSSVESSNGAGAQPRPARGRPRRGRTRGRAGCSGSAPWPSLLPADSYSSVTTAYYRSVTTASRDSVDRGPRTGFTPSSRPVVHGTPVAMVRRARWVVDDGWGTVGTRSVAGEASLLGGLALAGGGLLGRLGPGTRPRRSSAPPIIGCDGWGARPSRRGRPGLRPAAREDPRAPHGHAERHDHSAGAAVVLARAIQNFHMDRRGWPDTGQHFTVSRGGVRARGPPPQPGVPARRARQQVEGAHCTGQNVVAVGIENEGTYTAVDPPRALWDRLRATVRLHLQPVRHRAHRDLRAPRLQGHRLPRRPALRRAAAAAHRGRGAARAADRRRRVGPAALAAAARRRPRARRARRPAPAPRAVRPPSRRALRPRTADAVRGFQIAHRTEEINGILGGESWPLLVAGSPDGPRVLREAGMTPPRPGSSDPIPAR